MATGIAQTFRRWWAFLLGRPVPEEGPAAVIDPEEVRRAELALILGRDNDPDRPFTAQEAADVSAWGLALSGGGIRSATFGLGVLQALARNGLLGAFHYQSTISGGGYIGTFLQGLIRRRGFDQTLRVLTSRLRDRAVPGQPPADDPQQPIQHLREYSNYLAPRKTVLSGDTLGMIGTYVRNVLLVQVQLCALLLALCLAPIVLYRVVEFIASMASASALSSAGLLCVLATVLLGWVNKRANEDSEAATEDERPRHGVAFAALMVIVTLALASFIGAAALARLTALPEPLESASLALAPTASLDHRLAGATFALYVTVWLIWLVIDATLSFWNRGEGANELPSPLQLHRWRFLFASLCAGVFAGLIILSVRQVLSHWSSDAALWHAMILGPLITMSAVTLTGIVHVGLAGPGLDDLQREVWARVGGKTAGFVVVGITLTLALVIYGPWAVLHLTHFATSQWPGWAGAIAWLLTSGSGVMYARSQRSSGDKPKPGMFDRLVRFAPAVFVLGLMVAISLGAQALLRVAGWPSRPAETLSSLDAFLGYLALGANTQVMAVVAVAVVSLGLWILFGFAVNVNEFSMNAFYRNRLVRCYLGASNNLRKPEPITNFDPHDDLVLADVVEAERDDHGRRPLFPLIGTALNLIAAKQLDWQDRKAASFMLTPGYCGYIPPPSHAGGPSVGDGTACAGALAINTSTKDPIAAALSLGCAMSISGAAVSPNMGYHSSPAVTFLLTLFDARLGWWLANPNHPTRPAADSAPFSGLWLIAEMLGMTRDGGRYAYLSDGGHFENLGLYELVRRRCKFVLCVDAGADPARDFADLGNAVQKCRVDFGADIAIDVSALQPGANGLSARSCAVGSIDYADGTRGTLLYLKPSLTGAEPTDIVHYARVNPSFPHQPTSDQFFDEAQFESYRRLGDTIATNAIVPALIRAKADPATVPHGALGVHDSAVKERILVELKHRWVTPLPHVHDKFAVHGKAMSELFAKLRSTPELAVLDAQIYPAWTDLVSPDETPGTPEPRHPYERRTRLPSREHFRTCFYFCQELMQLMESVYHDLALEHACDHPDNRGWMNLFRHWSWSPMFRIAWAASAPTYGARFVAFCQTALDLPHLSDIVRVDELPLPPTFAWQQHIDALAETGALNHIEHGMLLSEPMGLRHEPNARLFVLRLKWRSVLSRTEERLHDTTLGIAIVVGTTLRVLRVQDHLRKLGLGAEFMRLLVARAELRNVDVASGHYGVVGVVTHRDAAALQAELEKLLQQALKHRRAANA